MAVLTVFNVLMTMYGWFKSADARAWWPLILLLQFSVTYIYAVAYVLLANHRRHISPSFLIAYHVALGAVLLVTSFLHYAIAMDGVAVDGGIAHLSLVKDIVMSPRTYYVTHLLFLGVAVIWSYAAPDARRSAHS